jgi:hypothetical protein
MKPSLRYALATLLIVGGAEAVTAAGTTTFGDSECAQWIDNPRRASKTWLMGFLSGMNLTASGKPVDPLDHVSSADEVFAWMDKYCRRNPEHKLSEAAVDFYLELVKEHAEASRQKGR